MHTSSFELKMSSLSVCRDDGGRVSPKTESVTQEKAATHSSDSPNVDVKRNAICKEHEHLLKQLKEVSESLDRCQKGLEQEEMQSQEHDELQSQEHDELHENGEDLKNEKLELMMERNIVVISGTPFFELSPKGRF